jgi:hypothetical protein
LGPGTGIDAKLTPKNLQPSVSLSVPAMPSPPKPRHVQHADRAHFWYSKSVFDPRGHWRRAMGTTIEGTKFVGMDFTDIEVDVQKRRSGVGRARRKAHQSGGDPRRNGRALTYLGPSFPVIDREP